MWYKKYMFSDIFKIVILIFFDISNFHKSEYYIFDVI